MPINDPQRRAEVIYCICNALKEDPVPAVRCAAAEALGKLGIEEYISPLLEAYRDEDSSVRQKVIESLGKLGEPNDMNRDRSININSNFGNVNAGDVDIQGDQIGTQNYAQSQQIFESLLSDFKDFVADLATNYPAISSPQSAKQTILVESLKLPIIRLQNFLKLRQLWNGGRNAAIAIGGHFAEDNVWWKGAIAFLEGMSEDIG